MTILHQKALKLPHAVAVEWFRKAIQEQGNCQTKSDWWAICYWLGKKKKTQQNILPRNTSARGRILPGIKRHSALLPHLKICLRAWGRLSCISMRWRFCYSLDPFPLSQRGQTEGAERGREKDIPSVPGSRGMDWEGKWLALGNDQEKPMYSIHGGCLGSFMLS